MQDRILEIGIMETYVRSLIDGYENKLQTTTKVNLKKQIEAQIYTCNSMLNYLQDRRYVLSEAERLSQASKPRNNSQQGT